MKTLNSLPDRFWNKIDITDFHSCWLWRAAKNRSGYGQFRLNGKLFIAHRLMQTLFESVPEGKVVMHKCDHPSCVNPSHLITGTVTDNNKDRAAKGRSALSHGIFNGMAKLNDKKIMAIRQEYVPRKVTLRALANKYNVDTALIHLIVKRKIWKHVK